MAGDVCKATPFAPLSRLLPLLFQPGFLSSLEIFDVSPWILVFKGFPGGAEVKAPACNVGDLGSIPGSGRSPGEGNGNPLSRTAWEIPWTEEPGRLQSIVSQKSQT